MFNQGKPNKEDFVLKIVILSHISKESEITALLLNCFTWCLWRCLQESPDSASCSAGLLTGKCFGLRCCALGVPGGSLASPADRGPFGLCVKLKLLPSFAEFPF